LRGRRISSIEQIAFDRVVHLRFGSDFESQESRQEHEFHLYLELFAQGNVILTNWEGRILTILRPVEVESTGKLAVGEIYDPRKGALELKELKPESFGISAASTVDLKSMARGPLSAFSPQMTDFCCKTLGIANKFSSERLDEFIKISNEMINEILKGDKFIGLLQVQKEVESKEQLLDPKCPAMLVSFHPLESFEILGTGQELFSIKFKTFNEAVDVYFSRLEAEKSSQKQVNSELEAERKLAAIGAEQQSRISGLQVAVEVYRRKGQLVTEFAEEVEAALKVARTAIDSGMDWNEFARLIESEKKNLNSKRAATAALFANLKLESGQISLKLGEEALIVDLIIGMSAHANATRLYDFRTQARLKMERTLAVHEIAMKSAAAKIRSEMLQSRQLGRVRQLQALRKPFWFEKFAWFISSDGFLVLAGRDAQQNELLVKKYLRAGDAYVHADVHGAGSLVVKNHVYPQLKTPPPKTLHEAGTFSICFSRAWEAKIVTSAWWVKAEQVSKTAPSGEYLGTGSFMIRGQKNFLPPMQLSLSFGFIFALDEEERKNKMMERKKREEEGKWCSEDAADVNYEKYRITEASEQVEGAAVIVNTAVPVENSINKTQKTLKKLQVSEKVQPEEDTKKTSAQTEKKSVRGKHGKEKKMKKKYADQDEEERAMRLELLGSVKKTEAHNKMPQKQPKEKESHEGKTEKVKEKTSLQEKQLQNNTNTVDYNEDEANEESIEFIAADFFTLNPEETGQYPFVLPVCFPTSALSSARFRIKLVPGTLKKGKAVKSTVSLLTNASTCTNQQWRDLIRAVPENEMLTVMPAKVALGVSVHETKKLKKPKKQKKPKN
jgi:predicted ribosome quality control (RQC) complex YloA/Tae2 family protein